MANITAENLFFHIHDIDWNTEGYEEYGYSSDPISELPSEAYIPFRDILPDASVSFNEDFTRVDWEDDDFDDEDVGDLICDWLGDEYGWLVNGFEDNMVYEV